MEDDLTPVDTGLLAAAAEVQQQPEMLSPAVPITVAVNPPVKLPKLSANDLVKLARELVMNIRDETDILADFKLDKAQLNALFTNEFFANAVQALTIEWNGAKNTPERLKIISAAFLEQSLPALGAKLLKADESLHAQVAAAEFFAKNAGIRDADKHVTSGEKFTISINLGADTQLRYEKDVTPTRPSEVSAIPEGSGDPFPVLPVSKGTGN